MWGSMLPRAGRDACAMQRHGGATYLFRLCSAILTCFRRQMLTDRILRDGAWGMQCIGDEELNDQASQRDAARVVSISGKCAVYYEDLTSQPPREDLVHSIAK